MSKCSDQTHARPIEFSNLTLKRIRFRADRLARAFRLSPEEREDLRQDLSFEVAKALHKHDPARGSEDALARGAMDYSYKHMARTLRSRRERAPRFVPLPESSSPALVDRHSDHVRGADLRLDLEPLLRALPRELGELAEQLKTKSVSEIASERGVHRGTVYRMVWQLRERLLPAAALIQ